jgi:transcriptional regulator GlxA family with amidase domain
MTPPRAWKSAIICAGGSNGGTRVRVWRLYLAADSHGATARPIIAIVIEAGFGSEAAFSRAFTRQYGTPPAEWRRNKSGQTT